MDARQQLEPRDARRTLSYTLTATTARPRDLRWRSGGWLAWFVFPNLLWLVFISAWELEEELLGLIAAAVGATAAEAVREQGLMAIG